MKTHDSPRHRVGTVALAGAALALLTVGCGSASAPTHFHTLMPPPAAVTDRSGAGAAIDWQVLPVKVPAQVDQPQWVLRVADGSLVMLEQERWIAPLADEIHAAVVERLSQTLGLAGSSGAAARWLVRIDVRRFDLVAEGEARLEADWSISRDDATLGCRATFVNSPQSAGYAALSRAQQKGVAQLADTIGAALKGMTKGQETGC